MWEIVWSRPAERDLQRLDPVVSERILEAIERLATTGQGDVRPLQGRDQHWRLRVGDWRVIFSYSDVLLFLLPDDDLTFVAREISAGSLSAQQGDDVFFRHVRVADLPM